MPFRSLIQNPESFFFPLYLQDSKNILNQKNEEIKIQVLFKKEEGKKKE